MVALWHRLIWQLGVVVIMLYAIVTWIYGKDHKLRYYTPDGKIRGKTLSRLGILAEDWDVSLEVLHELEDMIDARLKELDDQNS